MHANSVYRRDLRRCNRLPGCSNERAGFVCGPGG
nr:MAG TPA: hypothetical protein [Caudoviricetes sp.]